MEQLSINGFSNILAKTEELKSKAGRQNKLYLLDKCNWLISHIAKKSYVINKKFGEYVNINSTTFKDILGRDYKFIQKLMFKLELVEQNPIYSRGKFSKSYRLTNKAVKKGISHVPIYSKRFKTNFNRYLDRKFEKVYADPLFRKLLDNTAQLKLLNEPENFVLPLIPEPIYKEREDGIVTDISKLNHHQMDRYNAFFKALLSLNETNDPREVYKSTISFEPSIGKTNRVYHLSASIPRLIRECLRTKDNKLIYEVDMASAQPSILLLEWLKSIADTSTSLSDKVKKEARLCLDLVTSGSVYAYIRENSTYCRQLDYADLKMNILKTLNAKNYPSELNKELKKLFPNFMKWINSIKKEQGNKHISFIGQSTEANIFVEVYKTLPKNMFALIIHDSI
ncbi:MAG: hypothetical protein VXZ76_02940, partial [Bacteroidota bacterium]|nr:hypothetical protein [Bacteroidota bacterium]